MPTNNFKLLKNKSQWLRKEIFEMVIKVNQGHIASALSQSEILISFKTTNFMPLQYIVYYFLNIVTSQKHPLDFLFFPNVLTTDKIASDMSLNPYGHHCDTLV